jgi:hypothetical protein
MKTGSTLMRNLRNAGLCLIVPLIWWSFGNTENPNLGALSVISLLLFVGGMTYLGLFVGDIAKRKKMAGNPSGPKCYCGECGAAVPQALKFCGECGTQIARAITQDSGMGRQED